MSRIIAISHDPEEAGDRCTLWLQAHGYRVETACPAAGEAVPELADDVAGVVVFGGKYDVGRQADFPFLVDEMRLIEETLTRDLPFLGICLGGQLLAHVLGEDVDRHPEGFAEYGYYDLEPTAEGRAIFGTGLKVLQSHWHGWYRTPRGATRLASTAHFPEQAFRHGASAYGLQFHPEATPTMLARWIGRRSAERHTLKGAFPPERQLADNRLHDASLGRWFDGFLDGWIGAAVKR
ncbi:MAG: glutamine amidotransferase, partial [Alphaproteobacteria bacterium]|nr:glutamine amidotransferase [Alphaproteobacteria bacterium]